MVDIIQSIMEVYCDKQCKRLCPPDLNKLDDVRAGAASLTDLDEDDDIGGAWAWMIWWYMIMEALIRAGDAAGELILFRDNAIVHHNRVVTSYQSRIDKYRRRGVRIFDKIDVDPEMLKREQCSVTMPIPCGLPCKRYRLTSHCMVRVTVVRNVPRLSL